jgi:hypothetical protein
VSHWALSLDLSLEFNFLFSICIWTTDLSHVLKTRLVLSPDM